MSARRRLLLASRPRCWCLGTPLEVYQFRDERCIVGRPGDEYRLRMRNLSGGACW